jgi:hypothetical protein
MSWEEEEEGEVGRENHGGCGLFIYVSSDRLVVFDMQDRFKPLDH